MARRPVRFLARLEPLAGGGHYLVVPDDVAAQAGVVYRDRVRGTVAGAPYRASLARYSGEFHVGITNAVVADAGAHTGQQVPVTLEPDPDPLPGDTVPDDLTAALAAEPALAAVWDRLTPSHRREHVKALLDARRPETRARRLAALLTALRTAPPGGRRVGR